MAGRTASRVTVIVRGIGDVGSAVAHTLFHLGYAVVIHDGPAPTTSRRRMAFTDAVFDGRASLEGLTAERVDDLAQLAGSLEGSATIPVVIVPFDDVVRWTAADVIVDARMRKRQHPEIQRGRAPLTIGLGPNFVAGVTTDIVVETQWGDELGTVRDEGATRPLSGEPRPIGGHGRERFIYSPVQGIFATKREIGELVAQDELMAYVGPIPLRAPLAGVVRGLTRNGVPVVEGSKVIEIDPRGPRAVCDGIGERPRRIARGVACAIASWLIRVREVEGA